MKTIVTLTPPDQNWVIFPIDNISSIESLIADFTGHPPQDSA